MHNPNVNKKGIIGSKSGSGPYSPKGSSKEPSTSKGTGLEKPASRGKPLNEDSMARLLSSGNQKKIAIIPSNENTYMGMTQQVASPSRAKQTPLGPVVAN